MLLHKFLKVEICVAACDETVEKDLELQPEESGAKKTRERAITATRHGSRLRDSGD